LESAANAVFIEGIERIDRIESGEKAKDKAGFSHGASRRRGGMKA
jgi:hypothetical protein